MCLCFDYSLCALNFTALQSLWIIGCFVPALRLKSESIVQLIFFQVWQSILITLNTSDMLVAFSFMKVCIVTTLTNLHSLNAKNCCPSVVLLNTINGLFLRSGSWRIHTIQGFQFHWHTQAFEELLMSELLMWISNLPLIKQNFLKVQLWGKECNQPVHI